MATTRCWRVGLILLTCGACSATLFGAVAANAATSAASPIKPRSSWTFRLSGGGCEVDTFHAGGTFTTGSRYSDRGTYQATATSLTMVWTAGGDAGTRFRGDYLPSAHAFKGTWRFGYGRLPATVTEGVSC
jgi:hypothetical protein